MSDPFFEVKLRYDLIPPVCTKLDFLIERNDNNKKKKVMHRGSIIFKTTG